MSAAARITVLPEHRTIRSMRHHEGHVPTALVRSGCHAGHGTATATACRRII
jgi:hypothetical protein